MKKPGDLKFGTFFSPLHSPRGNPTRNLQRDIDLCVNLDHLGFDEVWVGEHHSTGWETVGSPELLLSHIAALTTRIRLGTGVVSVPYHNPYMIAARASLLDHISRGRFILGLGPGAFVTDAGQLGIDPKESRRKLTEGVGVIGRLLRGEVVTESSDWFTLNEARLQLLPYSDDLEIAVSSLVSPSGPTIAGINGASLLSLNASSEDTIGILAERWDLYERLCGENGHVADRSTWRLVVPCFLAETEEEAIRDVAHGIEEWNYYLTEVGPSGSRRATVNASPDDQATLHTQVPTSERGTSAESITRRLIDSRFAAIGTPDQVEAHIRWMQEQTGGFGVFLNWQTDWGTPEATARSHRLFADEVIPRFRRHSSALAANEKWVLSGA